MTQLSQKFDYDIVDENTSRFLKEKELNMRSIVQDVAPKLGKELKEAQDELAKHGYGCFEQWYESLGFKRQTVYNYINSYSFLQQLEEQGQENIANTIPANLMYEVGKKTANPEAVQAVISGEVTSLKEYKALEKALQEAEQRAAEAEVEARRWKDIAKSAQNQPPQVITNTIEKIPDHIKKKMEEDEIKLRTLRAGLDEATKELQQYKLQDTVEFDEVQSQIQKKKLQHEADMEALQLSIAYKQFIEKAAIGTYQLGALAIAEPAEKQRLLERVEIVQKILNDTKSALQGRKLGGVINE